MPIQLRQNYDIQLPDFQGNAELAVGYTPNPELPRVSEAQRDIDALAYKEQLFAVENLKDSLKVATAYVSAGVQATKLGRELIRYSVGIQDMRTEMVNLDRAVVRTQTTSTELQAEQLKLNHNLESLPHLANEYQSKLAENVDRANRARLKAEAFIHQTAQLYPH